MPYYPEDQSKESIKKLIRTNVCAECGRQLYGFLDRTSKQTYIACPTPGHEGIVREYQPQDTDYRSEIRREIELDKEHGHETSTALASIPKHGQLTQTEAMHILKLVYPQAPQEEIIRCAILCQDFGLHPLMKEVYLIPFKNKKTGKDDYVTVLGINATRKLMSQRGTYSYRDNTPRVMTDQEQKSIFGEVDHDKIIAITKLRSAKGMEAQGYGRIGKSDTIQGGDKGNTRANMAFIRSERNAFGRLFTDALPPDIEVIDDRYAEVPAIGNVDTTTGEIIEGEATVIEETPKKLTPEPEAAEEVHKCEEHGVKFTKKSKFGKDYWSHPLQGGKWCNEKDQQKKAEKPTAQAEPEPAPDPTESTAQPEKEEGNGIPQTTDELYAWVAEMNKWNDPKPARSWIVNKIKIAESKIDSDPVGCYHEIKALQGW